MKLVGRGSRSATKVSQRANLRRPLGSPRRQIAEPGSSMCQRRGEWNVPKSGFLVPVQPIPDCSLRRVFCHTMGAARRADLTSSAHRRRHARGVGQILFSFGSLALPANWPCNRNRLYDASCLGEILISFGSLAKPMLSYAPR